MAKFRGVPSLLMDVLEVLFPLHFYSDSLNQVIISVTELRYTKTESQLSGGIGSIHAGQSWTSLKTLGT